MGSFSSAAQSDTGPGYYQMIDQPADSEVTPENIRRRPGDAEAVQGKEVVLCLQTGRLLHRA